MPSPDIVVYVFSITSHLPSRYCLLSSRGRPPCRFCPTDEEACKYFSLRRTGDNARLEQGVTQPSQRRYVSYVADLLAAGGYHSPPLVLRKIVMLTCPHWDADGGFSPSLFVEEAGGKVDFDLRKPPAGGPPPGPDRVDARARRTEFAVGVEVQGDVRVTLGSRAESFGLRRDTLRLFLWFHTGFIRTNPAVFGRAEVDQARPDRAGRVLEPEFALEFHFDALPDTSPGADAAQLGPFRKVKEGMWGGWACRQADGDRCS